MEMPELFLLAGGASTRMGVDKLRLRNAAGVLLVANWFERLRWPTPPTLVLPPDGTAPEELAAWPVRHDAVGGEGPLRGLATVLTGNEGWRVVVAVDTPGIGREQLDFLGQRRAAASEKRLWMFRRGGRIEPFPLLIHSDFAAKVATRLAGGRRSVHGLAEDADGGVVEAPDWPAAVWRNLNRREELAEYLTAGLVPSHGIPGED